MFIGLWVTTACNLKCNYCYEGDDKHNEAMTIETANKVIDFIIQQAKIRNDEKIIVEFHGGEPLLNENIIRYVISKLEKEFLGQNFQLMFGITTNGTLISQNNINMLLEKMNYNFSISIDGKKETHDYYRKFPNGGGTYDLIVERINTCLADKLHNIRGRMTFDSNTVSSLYMNIKHMYELGFKTIVSVPDYFDKKWDEASMQILLEEMIKINEWAKSLEDNELLISIIDKNIVKKGICKGGINTFHISPKGYIYPCSYVVGIDEFQIGYLEEDNPLNTEKINSYQEIFCKKNPECIPCENEDCCISTRCKILNWLTTGYFLSPNAVVCNIENVKYKFLSLL